MMEWGKDQKKILLMCFCSAFVNPTIAIGHKDRATNAAVRVLIEKYLHLASNNLAQFQTQIKYGEINVTCL